MSTIKKSNKYGKTLFLPKNIIPIRTNLKTTEKKIQSFWDENNVFGKAIKKNKNPSKIFVLHDGPPFANGELHLGHAFNKIIKDFINRFYALNGFYTPYVVGWDTHGLPIENAVLKGNQKPSLGKEITSFQKECSKFVKTQISLQKEQLKKLGLFINLTKKENTYTTSSRHYVSQEISYFYEIFQKNLIYQEQRPVLWSPHGLTTLADSEVVHKQKQTTSVYVLFRVLKSSSFYFLEKLFFVVWTTTPWTLPANKILSVSPKLKYLIFRCHEKRENFIVSEDCFNKVQKYCSCSCTSKRHMVVKKNISGKKLSKSVCSNPLYPEIKLTVVESNHVTKETGTGVVHIAPHFGLEDYYLFKQHAPKTVLEESPLEKNGHFRKNFHDQEIAGLFYKKANLVIIKKLHKNKACFSTEEVVHNYPFDWRTNTELIYFLTKQYFLRVSAFKKLLKEKLHNIEVSPLKLKTQMVKLIDERKSDWCLTRQRYWGVPIPFFYVNRKPFLSGEIINYICEKIEKKGMYFWWKNSKVDKEKFKVWNIDWKKREKDILDVWFDSGLSYLILAKSKQLPQKADLVIEGYDQLKGWFTTSLITNTVLSGEEPFKKILVHGFIVDKNNEKMSKSKGNVIKIEDIIEKYGIEVFRLFTSSVDYRKNIVVGDEILKRAEENYNKIRNTLRFLAGNVLEHYEHEQKNTEINFPLKLWEEYVLLKLSCLSETTKKAYKSYTFTVFYKGVINFIVNDLSAFYFEICKDTLYLEPVSSYERKKTISLLNVILNTLLVLLSPILPHTTEEIYQALVSTKTNLKVKKLSVHMSKWPNVFYFSSSSKKKISDFWEKFFQFKNDFLLLAESWRKKNPENKQEKLKVTVHFKEAFQTLKKLTTDELKKLLSVYKVEVLKSKNETFSKNSVESKTSYFTFELQTDLSKCLRCWSFFETLVTDVCFACQQTLIRKQFL